MNRAGVPKADRPQPEGVPRGGSGGPNSEQKNCGRSKIQNRKRGACPKNRSIKWSPGVKSSKGAKTGGISTLRGK